MIRCCSTLFFLVLVAIPPAGAQDLTVEGCDERLAGEVGVAALNGNIGQEIGVPISVRTTGNVEAFVLDLELPAGVLTYLRTEPGNLTGGFDLLNGNFFSSTNEVRVSGIAQTPIPPDMVGELAIIVFRVESAGSGAFATSGFLDDISAYVSCEDVHGTSPVEPLSWGRVKASYY